MIALTVVTHPKTNAFLRQFLMSLSGELPPIYIVASGYTDFTKDQVTDMRRFPGETGGALLRWPCATWEAGAIDIMNVNADDHIKEFVFLQDTFEFKEGMFPAFWEKMEQHKGNTYWLTSNHQMYAAKFRREVLDLITPWPWATSKQAAVRMEADWTLAYDKAEMPWLSYQGSFMPDGQEEIEKCGRMNVRCENEYLIKWKGTTDKNLHERLREIDDEGKL